MHPTEDGVTDNAKDVKVEIGGMSCGGCVRRVTNPLKKADGVLQCDVEVGRATIKYDAQKIDLNKLLDVVRQTGFSVKGELA